MNTPTLTAIANQVQAHVKALRIYAEYRGTAEAWTAWRQADDAARYLHSAQLHLEIDERKMASL